MSDRDARIDWSEVKSRLKESQQALEKVLTASPERAEAVFRQRAAQLAGRRVRAEGPTAALRLLVFVLRGERYGLDFGDVVELLPFANCTPVPGAPPQLVGVTNVRGEIRSVVDLGRLLDLPENDQRGAGYILLVRHQGREVGLRVDGIDKLQSVLPEELAVPADETAEASLRYLRGLAPDKLRVLRTEALFAHSLFQNGKAKVAL
jgi:purine-binding chemotaxis protein CheW